MAFIRIHDIVCLDQDLVIHSPDILQRMVMPDKVHNPGVILRRKTAVLQERFGKRHPFFFLIFPVRVSILFPAQRAGNVMKKRCSLQDFLRSAIQPLQLSDRSGE